MVHACADLKPVSFLVVYIRPRYSSVFQIQCGQISFRNLFIGDPESGVIHVLVTSTKSQSRGPMVVYHVSDVVVMPTESPLVGEVPVFQLQVIRLAFVRGQDVQVVDG